MGRGSILFAPISLALYRAWHGAEAQNKYRGTQRILEEAGQQH